MTNFITAAGISFALVMAPTPVDVNMPAPTAVEISAEDAGAAFSLQSKEVVIVKDSTEEDSAEEQGTDEQGKIQEYSQEDLKWLSRLIYAEAGSDNCSDELQLAVGSVAINRKNSSLYPDTIKGVVFDKHWGWQYGCVKNKSIYKTPDDRAVENARYLLENGSILPENVLGQGKKAYLHGKYCSIQGVIFSFY